MMNSKLGEIIEKEIHLNERIMMDESALAQTKDTHSGETLKSGKKTSSRRLKWLPFQLGSIFGVIGAAGGAIIGSVPGIAIGSCTGAAAGSILGASLSSRVNKNVEDINSEKQEKHDLTDGDIL